MLLTTDMTKRCFSHPSVDVSTVVHLLRWRATHQPDRRGYTFLLDGETNEISITYAELDHQARNIAAQLQGMVTAGETVLLLYPPNIGYIAAFFGCLYAGAIAVPCYPPRRNRPNPSLPAIVADSQAKVALTTTAILSDLHRQLPYTPQFHMLHWLTTDTLDRDLAAGWKEPYLDPDMLAFLQYTSGSTGTPKGVMVSHGNLLHNEHMIACAFGHSDQTVVVGWLPLFHDMGLIGNVLQPLYLGVPCILMPSIAFLQKPYRWLQAISRYRATTSGGPNFAYDLCVRQVTQEQRAGLDLRSWKIAFNGAETVRAEVMAQFAEMFAQCGFRSESFYPCYGMAEGTLLITGGAHDAPLTIANVEAAALEQHRIMAASDEQAETRTIVGCGWPWLDQTVVIVNPETSTPCPADRVGEIWVSGSSVAQGYWNLPELTQQTFQARLANGDNRLFLRTGDLGYLHDELYITGRLKDVIIICGRNHYPQDIELTVQESHPALQSGMGAAFSVEVDGEEQLVVAHEVKHTAYRRLNIKEVIGNIRQAVAQQHDLSIHAVVLLKTGGIPKTSSGKVQRSACRAAFLAGGLNVIDEGVFQHANPEP